MERFTYRGENGEAYINYLKTDYTHAIMRFAELEDAVETAAEIQNLIGFKKEDAENMLKESNIDLTLLVKNKIKLMFSEVRSYLYDMSDGKSEFDFAIQRLDESEFWAIKAVTGE
jgi:hypothetical protein